jgi:hypothetical protein
MLFGSFLAAPHSIAGGQGGFLAAALFWLLSCAFAGRIAIKRTPLDWPLLGLFAWATLSAAFSYERLVSFDGLRGLAFFSIFYFVATRASEGRRTRQLAFTLILSCLVNVGYTFYQKAVGDGLRIDSMSANSRLARIGLMPGDVLLTADGKPIKSLEELSNLIDAGAPETKVKIGFRRGELMLDQDLNRKHIERIKDASGAARFGITVARARDFRAHGFYNHYATYAEVLQLIASLAFGFLLACPRQQSRLLIALAAIGLALTAALIFTATRAPLAALMISIFAMVMMARGLRRYALIALIIVALPVGVYAIAKWRGVGFFDKNDGSVTWRLEVWQEGIGLSLKHPIFGIGKGSERKHWREWGLYRNGELPPGHFHCTPLQIAVWWGMPAVLLYAGVMFQALRMLFGFLRKAQGEIDWQRFAIVLGALGGLIGFNISSLVHFNFGDGEVAMALWLILGLAMAEILNAQTEAIILSFSQDPEPIKA